MGTHGNTGWPGAVAGMQQVHAQRFRHHFAPDLRTRHQFGERVGWTALWFTAGISEEGIWCGCEKGPHTRLFLHPFACAVDRGQRGGRPLSVACANSRWNPRCNARSPRHNFGISQISSNTNSASSAMNTPG